MLYTRKGDTGTTKLFDCPKGTRLKKNGLIFEALGTLDELNSSLGFAKVLTRKAYDSLFIKGRRTKYEEVLEKFQHILFTLQAELGGSPIHAKKEHTLFLEDIIYEIETVIPPINSFVLPGGGEAGAYLDVCRTLARRAERLMTSVQEKEERKIHEESIQFVNRLSSALYALARHANYQEGHTFTKPDYI